MRDNLNILVPDLNSSQRNYYLIRNINAIHEHHPNVNIQVFAENLSRFCMKPHFSVMNVSEAWAQQGPFIACSLSTASKLINYPIASKKLFYIWDLEFIRGDNRIYDIYAPVYLHPQLELVCPSKEHADLLENSFNKEVTHIINNFDIKQLLELTNVK